MRSKKISEGDSVRIELLSPASYALYKDYRRQIDSLVCPCKLKGQTLSVSAYYDNDVMLCYCDLGITVLYGKDVVLVEDALNV